jgi:D-2-hydroxyacid dehydrogenase (NADP+)
MTQVVVLLPFAEGTRQRLRAHLGAQFPNLTAVVVEHRDELMPALAAAEVLMTYGKPLGPKADELIAQAPALKWIQCLGTGLDNIIDLPSLRPDVLVTSTHGIQGGSLSEAAILAMLALSRDYPRFIRNQDRRVWDRWAGSVIEGKTVGILGVGAIAESLAPRCRALGMTVIGITSTPRAIVGFDRMYPRVDLERAVREVDHLVLLAPFSPATRHIINAKVLAAMKPTSFLINLARGGLIDDDALIAALRAGQLAGAALDAFVEEPLPADHPYWTMPNVIMTAHAAGFTHSIDDRTIELIDKNLRRYLVGDMKNMINVIARTPGALPYPRAHHV